MSSSTDSFKAMSLHGALLWAVAAWTGVMMVVPGPNPKLLLIAHSKGLLHGMSLMTFSAAGTMGCFPSLSSARARLVFLLMAGGAWGAFITENMSAFLNTGLPMGAAKAGAAADTSSVNAILVQLSGLTMGAGAVVMCSGMDVNLLWGGESASSGKKKS